VYSGFFSVASTGFIRPHPIGTAKDPDISHFSTAQKVWLTVCLVGRRNDRSESSGSVVFGELCVPGLLSVALMRQTTAVRFFV
jgi:hypothetical protein